jgi:TPR repeat protein
MVRNLFKALLLLFSPQAWAMDEHDPRYDCFVGFGFLPIFHDRHMQQFFEKVEQQYGEDNEKIVLVVTKEIQRVADEGNPDALLSLGAMYDGGICVQRDKAKAMAFYTRAAERGSPRAQEILDQIRHRPK